jgi:hypothetical protein
MEFFRPLIQQWLAELKRVAFVGSDLFFYFERHNASARTAPDVYLTDNVPQDCPLVASWKLWEGNFPSFAFESCGDDIDKRQAKEQECQEKEQERQAKEHALAELIELRKLLAEMKKPE